jgi:aspartokinase
MITIPEAVESIIKKSLFLEEALSRGIVNLSALARLVKPDVERELMKEAQESAITIALIRLSKKIGRRKERLLGKFKSVPDIIVRSNLVEVTYSNSSSVFVSRKKLLDQLGGKQAYFLTFTQGINETTIIASRDLKDKIKALFTEEDALSWIDDLSSITVLLPPDTAMIPGTYSYILKALSWEGINIVEVVSTLSELTIVLDDLDIDRAFSIIKRLF